MLIDEGVYWFSCFSHWWCLINIHHSTMIWRPLLFGIVQTRSHRLLYIHNGVLYITCGLMMILVLHKLMLFDLVVLLINRRCSCRVSVSWGCLRNRHNSLNRFVLKLYLRNLRFYLNLGINYNPRDSSFVSHVDIFPWW